MSLKQRPTHEGSALIGRRSNQSSQIGAEGTGERRAKPQKAKRPKEQDGLSCCIRGLRARAVREAR